MVSFTMLLNHKPIACWVILNAFLPSADFFSSKSTFSKKALWITIKVSNSLDPDQARYIVGPDLGPNHPQSYQ